MVIIYSGTLATLAAVMLNIVTELAVVPTVVRLAAYLIDALPVGIVMVYDVGEP